MYARMCSASILTQTLKQNTHTHTHTYLRPVVPPHELGEGPQLPPVGPLHAALCVALVDVEGRALVERQDDVGAELC